MAAIHNHYLLYLLLRRRSLLLHSYRRKQKVKRKRARFWVRKLYEERRQKGEYELLVRDLQLYDHEMFFSYFGMLPSTFEVLLKLIGSDIKKNITKMRKPIGPSERLCVTLRYLVTGDAHSTIAANYRISPTTVGRIVKETSHAIWNNLVRLGYLKVPSNKTAWEKVAYEFENHWNFPNAIGAIDGKHVQMFAPAGAGSSFFNYKKTHSIVLLGVCDANYKFILVDIGDSGRQSDGSVYANSNLGHAIENKLLNIPGDRRITNSSKVLPFVFIGDDAFGLKRHMMKPYPFSNLCKQKLVFNYRLSRARRVIENTFGICASRFRVFYKPIVAKVQNVIAITKAVVALHNFLMKINDDDDLH
ncbi:uncharacterized protein LOC124443422 [Xenia sp. Carnegie-2017]|uniref:uncharacterized protein LOC124443422 n=1 Tax=Xenia sp. Carnegie-2017 TaxID=2897299 RepID=UPI001F03326C|nr:uncharacterized protein LOC124443422 [Xenia sp. Carnegie-2017]